MKALFTVGGVVPFARVAADHRRWLAPLAAALANNIGVLAVVVTPLSRAVESGGVRSARSAELLAEAKADLGNAEATRDSQAQATRDLDRFYKEVLPTDAASARRITHLRLSQMAREHDVTFQRSTAAPELGRDSDLERLRVSYALSGEWEDIRTLIHAIETVPEFIVIDNVVLSEGSDEAAPLTLTLDMSTFYRVRAGHVR